jgi:hypothetical protein
MLVRVVQYFACSHKLPKLDFEAKIDRKVGRRCRVAIAGSPIKYFAGKCTKEEQYRSTTTKCNKKAAPFAVIIKFGEAWV